MGDLRRILTWILATWPRRSRRRNPIEELHAFFAERLTDSGKAISLLWLVSLTLAMIPGWSPAKLLFPLFTSVLFVSLLLAFRPPSLKAVLLSTGHAVEGEVVELRFRLENTSRGTLEFAGVGLFRARDGLASRDAISVAERVDPGATCDLSISVRCVSRGPTGFPGIGVVKLDPFGLARSRRIDFLPIELCVAPASLRIQPERFLFEGASGAAFADAAGIGADRERIFQGVRPFREGDRLRDLDHKSWARWNIPIVREFASAPRRGIVVFVETGCDSLLERSLVDPMLRLAAGVAVDFCRREWLVGLVVDGARVDIHVDSVDEVVSVFSRIPRCGWGQWPRAGSVPGLGDDRSPVLWIGVSRRVALADKVAHEGAVGKRVLVVAVQDDPRTGDSIRQIPASRIASGEVVL